MDRANYTPGQQKVVALFEAFDVDPEDWREVSGRVIAFAHSLKVPAGPHVHRPLRLKPFQKDFIRRVYNPKLPDGRRAVRQAVLSVARRNGKTLILAVMVLAHLAGPLKKPNSTMVSAATSRKQAGILFRFVAAMVRLNPKLGAVLKVVDSTKRIVHLADGSTYEAIAAEAGSQFGEGLDFAVYDELAQAKNRNLYDALMTSLGAQVEPLMVAISTQAPSDEHLLSEMIDYGLKVNAGEIEDPSFAVQLHAAAEDCDLMDEAGWYAANPGLGDYRDETELRSTMARAVKLPSLENAVRNLYLNQRTRTHASFLSRSVWDDCAAPVVPDIFLDGRPVAAGLDLSARTDLSALVVAAHDDDGRINLLPIIWTPEGTLEERQNRDRAPYEAWAKQGFLIPIPGPVIDYDYIAEEIVRRLMPMLGLRRVYFDRWRIDVLQAALARLGAQLPLEPFGQGFKDFSPAVETFESHALEDKIRHGGHPVLRWCMTNSAVSKDAAGNRKLDKDKSTGRIDAAVAAVMAIAALTHDKPPAAVDSMIA